MGNVHEGFRIDEEYDHDYEVEVLVDSPTSKTIPRYGSGSGVILKIYPLNAPPFIFTVRGQLEDLRLLSWPDPRGLVVMPSAIFISSTDPGNSSRALPGFDGHSVHYVRQLHSPNIVLLGHCCAIYCYDEHGMRWSQTDLFCCDDPTIDVSGDMLILTAHKHGVDGDKPTEKFVSLATGEQHNGRSRP